MDGLFSYVFSYIFLMTIVLCTLLLFPFFPMLSLSITVLFMIGIATVISLTPVNKQENGVERARS
ncbi:hypothetical protein [Bacillus sp. 165]|uniref:hypothetical protein n=1 Tax=Bacillus sp. 165 TaxID=1529117 RepID=UPI001AD9A529|nr:hypothetical protein [Bacillus sp. 165]MBO9131398.1 hypothetical protein [Bacillus sp. 165]